MSENLEGLLRRCVVGLMAAVIAGAGLGTAQVARAGLAPVVSSVAPATGSSSGKTTVDITGEGLGAVTSVRFGGVDSQFFKVLSDKLVVALSPPQPTGTIAQVTVAGTDGTSPDVEGARFTYETGEWQKTTALDDCRSDRYSPDRDLVLPCDKRQRHTSTLLGDGRVLVVGGSSGSGTVLGGRSTAQVYEPATESWTEVSVLPDIGGSGARYDQTATLLGNGTVLIAGGAHNGGRLDSAVIFQPGTNDWRAVADPMSTTRSEHSSTVLDGPACHLASPAPYCGRVLLAGGNGTFTPSSELYDPVLGRWGSTGEMTILRFGHTATALPNGKVLVVGGRGVGAGGVNLPAIALAELYDPATGNWSAAGANIVAREGHTASLLPGGKVLVAGGRDEIGNGTNSTEIFNSDTGTWSSGPPLGQGRSAHTATTLPGGEILVTGGDAAYQSGGMVSAEIYDPATSLWTPRASMQEPRHSHAAVLLGDGGVMVTGGKSGEALGSSEVFRSVPARSPRITALAVAHGPSHGGSEVRITGANVFRDDARVEFDGQEAPLLRFLSSSQLLVLSPPGEAGSQPRVKVTTSDGPSPPSSAATFSYDHRGSWTREAGLDDCAPPSPSCTGRLGHSATVLDDGRLLVAGGASVGSARAPLTPLATAEIYDPSTGGWRPTGSLATARFGHTAIVLGGRFCKAAAPPGYCGKVLVTGGTGASGALAQAELFDPSSGTWSSCAAEAATAACPAPMSLPRDGHSAAPLGGGVLVAGGNARSAELYDPGAGRWTRGPDMTMARSKATVTPLDDGRVLVAGGGSSSSEIYDPVANTWLATAGKMSVVRSRHTATLLADGSVLVAGGRGRALPDGSFFMWRSGERYDPSSGMWLPTPPMATARIGHAANRLPSGDVLVTGAGTAELYLASADRWGMTSSARVVGIASAKRGELIPADREPQHHTTTLLQDGTVVAAGGFEYSGKADNEVFRATPNVEVFHPTRAEARPAVTSFNPRSGPATGGTTVEIRGLALYPLVGVRFGGAVASVSSNSDSRIVVMAPPQRPGPVEVTIDTPAGSRVVGSFSYTREGGWHPVGPLLEGRYLHTATLLDGAECRAADPPNYCGLVLVAGGTVSHHPSGGAPLAMAELYDPRTRLWSATGSMSTDRYGHTATALGDGRVLVAGGQNQDGKPANSETYDPRTGQWANAGALATPRFAHTATRLDGPACRAASPPGYCGKVLIAGGATSIAGRPSLSSAELFDPATGGVTSLGPWSATGALSVPRADHTATLLPDGRVLVAGGGTTGSADTLDYQLTGTAEIYDPKTSSWSRAPDLAVARLGHSATLLSGDGCADQCGRVLVVGGVVGGFDFTKEINPRPVFSASAELFAPAKGTWSPVAGPSVARGGHAASLLVDGTVVVAGGGMPFDVHTDFYDTISSTERYDPATGAWTYAGDLGVGRGIPTTTVLTGAACERHPPANYCGNVLAVGGAEAVTGETPGYSGDNPPPLKSADVFTPAAKVVSVTPARGSAAGGSAVIVRGVGFSGVTAVSFGGTEAEYRLVSPTEISVVTPPHLAGPAIVAVTVPGAVPPPGDSPIPFIYIGSPGAVTNLSATALSDTRVALTFTAPDDGTTQAPAARYVIKQSEQPITELSFEAADSLCDDGICVFPPGQTVELAIDGLRTGTAYHYRVVALNELAARGPLSDEVQVTTAGAPTSCRPIGELRQGEVLYRGGRYSLVGLPQGTLTGSGSVLYSWWNRGAGGEYSVHDRKAGVEGGRGYWSWSACDRVVTVLEGSPPSAAALDAYSASMVGNPSLSPAQVAGHDFAARWDPDMNRGAGGYKLSGYREPLSMAVGEGLWVFSYVRTQVRIGAPG